METLATILTIASGFVLMRYHQPPAGMIATSLLIDAALAPLTAVVASRRGRSVRLWSVLGLILGIWALACVLLMRSRRDSSGASYPPTSDAA
jgi:hypothetical protein